MPPNLAIAPSYFTFKLGDAFMYFFQNEQCNVFLTSDDVKLFDIGKTSKNDNFTLYDICDKILSFMVK